MAKVAVKKAASESKTTVLADVKGYARKIYLAGLGAYAKAGKEGAGYLKDLVKAGESVEKQGKQLVDEQVEAANSQLDSVLRSRGIRHLVFVGIATNVCVESTLRDGFFLEYFGVVLEDATHQAGPDFVQKAALYNIETFFGWVSSVADFKGVVGQIAPASEET